MSNWTPENLPNPKQDPAKCGRLEGIPHSNICDPDKLLQESEYDIVDGYNQQIKQETVAILVRNMCPTYIRTVGQGDKMVAAGTFARKIHDTWGVGDNHKNDGVVIFIATEDRVVYISGGEGIKDELHEQAIQSIISGMRPFLQQKAYGRALEYAMIQIDYVLENHRDSDGSNNHWKNFWNRIRGMDRGLLGLGVVVMLLIFGKWKEREMDALLTKGNESFPRIFESDDISCPYCLETYDGNSRKRMLMNCGHNFCASCYDTLKRVDGTEVGTCVICAKPLELSNQNHPYGFSGDTSSREFRENQYFKIYEDIIPEINFDTLIDDLDRNLFAGDYDRDDYRETMRKKGSNSKMRHDNILGKRHSFGRGNSAGGSGGGGSWDPVDDKKDSNFRTSSTFSGGNSRSGTGGGGSW